LNLPGLLGPEKAAGRMQELQARIDSFSTQPSGAGNSFQGTLASVTPADPSQFTVSPSSAEIASMADSAAAKHGLDPKIFRALVSTESNWNPDATSKVGASGLCQLMPATAQTLGVTDRSDPQQSLEGGAKYLKQMLDQFGGDYSKALAAYNAGPNAVVKAHGVPHYHETVSYVRKILGMAENS
jgi:soluble lytic murein transglycosylase-like protein